MRGRGEERETKEVTWNAHDAVDSVSALPDGDYAVPLAAAVYSCGSSRRAAPGRGQREYLLRDRRETSAQGCGESENRQCAERLCDWG